MSKNLKETETYSLFKNTFEEFSSIENGEISMGSRRICDKCGKEKDIQGGKTCENGHFICHSCVYYHIHCPLCGKRLR